MNLTSHFQPQCVPPSPGPMTCLAGSVDTADTHESTPTIRRGWITLCCVVIIFFVQDSPSSAQSTSPALLSLQDAVAIASAANPEVTVGKANERGAAADIRTAQSQLLPKIAASEVLTDSTDPVFAFGARLRQGRFTAADFSADRLNSPGATVDFMSTATAMWTLFDFGRTLHQVRGARTNLKATEQQTQAVGQSIAFSAVRAYYRALLSDQDRIASAAAVSRAQAFARQAHDRVDTGMALPADAMQADVEVALREQDAAEADSNQAIAYSDLAGTLGDPSKHFNLAAPAGTPADILAPLNELQSQALQRRPDLLALRSRSAAAGQTVKASHAAYGPQLSTFASVQADNPHLLSGGASNWTVGGKIELQVFDGGARRAETSRAAAAMDGATARTRQAEIEAVLEVERVFYARQTAQRQYRISAEMLTKTQETLRTAQDRYSAGLVTITEVLREQEQLRDMELNRARSLHRWWIADAQLRLATGDTIAYGAGVNP